MTNLTMLVHDRPRLTEQALRSLYENTDKKSFTLTCLDDASSDFRTTRLLERYAADHRNMALLTLKTSRGITGQARNLAVYWSEKYFGAGDWLALADNDTWYSPGWLEKLTTIAECTEPNGFRLWGGQVHPYHQPVNRTDDLPILVQSGECAVPVKVTEHSMLDGPSWLMRWDTWHKYGPLECHTPGVCQGEDVTFCQAITAAGDRIGVIHPHVVAHTGIRQSNGNLAPGAEIRLQQAIPTVIYE